MKTRIACANQLIALALVVAFSPIVAKAQTIISNETLVTTTFVVNQTGVTAKCDTSGCSASKPMLVSIPVTCPAAIGKTCTFHIDLDARVEVSFRCGELCDGPAPFTHYQFLVDGAPPAPGPVDAGGKYLFEKSAWTASEEWSKTWGNLLFVRQSYPASILAAVTNTSSGNHTIDVNVVCTSTKGQKGCMASAGWSTMRIDVFEP